MDPNDPKDPTQASSGMPTGSGPMTSDEPQGVGMQSTPPTTTPQEPVVPQDEPAPPSSGVGPVGTPSPTTGIEETVPETGATESPTAASGMPPTAVPGSDEEPSTGGSPGGVTGMV